MEKHKVIRSAGIVGSLTLVSRFLGLARDVLMAGFFGTSVYMSAFAVAFTIPNLFRRLFGEGALAAAFVPVFIESRQREGEEHAWAMARKVITLVGSVLVVITALGVLAAALAAHIPDLSLKTAAVLELLQIMLPYMIFICLAAMSMAILNSYGHFAVPAATPCLLNLSWIVALALVCPRVGPDEAAQIRVVAWAVLIGGVIQLGMQFPILLKHGYRPGLSFDWRDERVLRVFQLMGPAALGLAVTQFNVLIDRILAAWIGDWAPAALFFSERLIYLPLGMFATALGTVLLPTFAEHAARDDLAKLLSTVSHSLRSLVFVMMPAALGLLVLARPIVQMIFQWGEFTDQSTDLTAVALQFYAPGLVVFSLSKVLVPAFYGRQDTRTPVRLGLWTVALNLALNLTFVFTWPLYLKHAGLALATVLAEGFYAVALAVVLHRRMGNPGWGLIMASALRALALAGVMAAVIFFLHPYALESLAGAGLAPKFRQILAVLLTVSAGGLLYAAGAVLLGFPETREIRSALRRR